MSDVRYALRTMLQRPGLTATIVLTLALGIGATTAMFSVLYAVLLRSLPFAQPQRLVLVRTHYEPQGEDGPVSAPDYRDFRDQAHSFSSLAAIRFVNERTVVTGGSAERVRETSTSVNFLDTLGVHPWRGRFFSAEEERGRVAVISYEYWQRRFGGTEDVIGKTLTVDGEADAIVGILPPRFQCVEQVDLWRPMEADPTAAAPRRAHNWSLVGRLRDGASLDGAQAELQMISRRLAEQYPDSNKGVSLRAADLQEALVHQYRTPLLVLMAAVTLVLLIACGNVAGLLLARGAARRQEIAVRIALGASPRRLVRQLLTESLLLAAAGGLLGLAVGAVLERLLLTHTLWSDLGTAPAGADPRVLLFALATSLMTAVLAGLAPALAARRSHPAEDLKAARTRATALGTRLRSLLVSAQIALSVTLLVGSGLLVRTLLRLQDVNPGFDATHLLTAKVALPPVTYPDPGSRVRFFQSLDAGMRGRPGIVSVGMINLLPILSPYSDVGIWPADRPPTDRRDAHVAYWRRVMPGYFETMRIPLLSGRTVQEQDRSGRSNVIVLSQSLARLLFPDRDPVGRWIVLDTMRDEPYRAEVVGVVGDEKIGGLASDAAPAMYVSYLQSPSLTMQVVLRTAGDPALAAASLRDAVANLDKAVPASGLQTMEDIIQGSLGGQRFSAQLLSLFAATAVLLAAIGLYGVLAFFVSQRTQEIGVRMALGASRATVLIVVVRRGMLLVAGGLAAGLAISWWGTRLLRSLLFGVAANDIASFLGALVLLAAIGIAACLVPAWRATKVDPMVALRSE